MAPSDGFKLHFEWFSSAFPILPKLQLKQKQQNGSVLIHLLFNKY